MADLVHCITVAFSIVPRLSKQTSGCAAGVSPPTQGGSYDSTYGSENPRIAYFSMEIKGLTNALPTYSGGLGVLAGIRSSAAELQFRLLPYP